VIEHRFTKTMTDYASGALVLVRTRIAEHKKKYGAPPAQLLLHPPLARRLFSEHAAAHGLPGLPDDLPLAGAFGKFDGTPVYVCGCGQALAEDQIIDWLGKFEPL
jgi:hypothetical protein